MSAYKVAEGATLSYKLSGTVEVQETGSTAGGVFLPGATFSLPLGINCIIVASADYTSGLAVTVTQTVQAVGVSSEVATLNLTGTTTVAVLFNAAIETEIWAERVVEPDRTVPGYALPLYDANPGNGLELCKMQSIRYFRKAVGVTCTGSINAEEITPIVLDDTYFTGSIAPWLSEIEYGYCILSAGIGMWGQENAFDFTIIDLVYEATDGTSTSAVSEPFTATITRAFNAEPGQSTKDVTVDTVIGGGVLRLSVSSDDTADWGDAILPPNPPNNAHAVTFGGDASVVDYCDAMSITPTCSLKYMWDDVPYEMWPVVGADQHILNPPHVMPRDFECVVSTNTFHLWSDEANWDASHGFEDGDVLYAEATGYGLTGSTPYVVENATNSTLQLVDVTISGDGTVSLGSATDGAVVDIQRLGSGVTGRLMHSTASNIPSSLAYQTTGGMLSYAHAEAGQAIIWNGRWGCKTPADNTAPGVFNYHYEVNDSPPGTFGPYSIVRDESGTWVEMFQADDLPVPLTNDDADYAATTEHMLVASPPYSTGQPAHHPWKPWPHIHDPEDALDGPTEPSWYDSSVYISNSQYLTARDWNEGLSGWELFDILTFQLPAPGESTEALDLAVDVDVADWDTTACAATLASGALHLVPSGTPASVLLPVADGLRLSSAAPGANELGRRLTGRFAVIHWKASVAGATATIAFGQHSWTITAVGTGWNDTEIDLLRPDTGTAGNMQSIISLERPWERAFITGTTYDRPEPDATYTDEDEEEVPYFTWDFPVGWGVGRITSIGISCNDTAATYDFTTVSIRRRKVEDGGFAELLVLPHQASWNDSRTLGEQSNPESGTYVYGPVLTGDPDAGESNGPQTKHMFDYVKAILVIDGAVCCEVSAGRIQWDEVRTYIYEGIGDYRWAGIFYEHVENVLMEGDGTPRYDSFYPRDDYSQAPATVSEWTCVPGITATINALPTTPYHNEFIQNNCLVAGLIPGIYRPDVDDKIGVGFRLMTNSITYTSGMSNCGLWDVTEWRGDGVVCGVAFDGNEPRSEGIVTIEHPEASPGRVDREDIRTNKVGWFRSRHLNTRAYDLGGTYTVKVDDSTATLRNRMATRVVV